jgi:hypothetical protein
MKKRHLLAASVLALAIAASRAQVSVTGSNITDAFERPVSLARLCFVPVNASRTPTGFLNGSNQVVPNEVCGTVTAGTLQSGITVAPNATGTYYHVYLKQAVSSTMIQDYGLAQLTGSSWSFNAYNFLTAATVVTMGTVTTGAPGTQASCYITGSGPMTLNCTIPQGAVGPASPPCSVAIGTVTALASGAAPTVTNSGTTCAAVLNFGIPAGSGSSGGTGGTGGSTFAFSVNGTVTASTANGMSVNGTSVSTTATTITVNGATL